MPDTVDQHWERVETWLTLPARSRRVFTVTGTAGSGKTRFLADVRRRIPHSAWIDCRGLTADAVAAQMRAACRTEAVPGSELVIFLANVQYAGELLTSSEPLRVAGTLAPGFKRFGTRQVWVMAEHDPELVRTSTDSEYEIVLPEPSSVGPPSAQPPVPASRDERDELLLDALAIAETRGVPLPVWQLLCAAAGTPVTAEELLTLPQRRPDALATATEDAVGAPVVRFLSDASAHARRRARPHARDTQANAAEALLASLDPAPEGTWPPDGPVARYATRALPVHAALAGALSRVTENGSVLARCERAGLYEALRVAHPGGVPYASTAALVHYLEVQGITPSSQGEWVAWLHHAALSAGRTRLAGELLHAGVDLPWHTVWSRWRPAGVFGAWPGEAGRVDEVGVSATGPTTVRLVTARDTTTGKNARPKYTYLRQEWDAVSGAPASAPVTVRGALVEGDGDWDGPGSRVDGSAVVFAHHTAGGWESASALPSPPPRCPVSVTHGVRIDGTWVLAGKAGLFAVTTHAEPVPHRPPFPSRPLVAAHCRSEPWPLPDRAAAALLGEGVRDWLEETFGSGSCHRLDESQLPPGLSDVAARDFLTTTGLPEVRDFLHLSITPRGDRPLHEVPWPGRGRDVPRRLRARSEAPGDGPFYELGAWMYSNLLLDGRTGRVLRDTTGGMAEPLAGSSLLQFFAMVRLFDEFRGTHGRDAVDHKDARASLRAWCERIDPDAAHGEVWNSVLEGFDFEDSTWDLTTYGDDTL